MKSIKVSDETFERIKDQLVEPGAIQDGEVMRIIIADNRGLTFVGKTNLEPCDKGYITIRGAQCIIYWGTTKHLAELGDGPTKKTKLGKARTVRVPAKNIVAVYECGGGWGG
jgi:hypothetical protein